MHLIAEGMTNDDVARRLVISPATVKTHVNHIFTKLGARDRVRAVLIFRAAHKGDLKSDAESSSARLSRSRNTTVG